jgi:hypothetical protein
VQKLAGRLRKEGDGGILHRLWGRASKRKIPEAVRQKAVKLVQRDYRDYGPTLAAEYLAEKHRLPVSLEKLRQWMIEAGVWKRKRRRVEEVHIWRARRSQEESPIQLFNDFKRESYQWGEPLMADRCWPFAQEVTGIKSRRASSHACKSKCFLDSVGTYPKKRIGETPGWARREKHLSSPKRFLRLNAPVSDPATGQSAHGIFKIPMC